MVDLMEHLVQDAPDQATTPGRWQMTRHDACINCGRCATSCIYGVHGRDGDDPRWMAAPASMKCVGCHNCLEVCPVNALELGHQDAYEDLGGSIMGRDQVMTTWREARNGRIPVTGGGYKGAFSGRGFDAMWTDMSEIVRPTRDGIHGREKIHTAVDIGHRPVTAREEPRVIQVGIPVLFSLPFRNAAWSHLAGALERTAELTGTLSLQPMPGQEGRIWRDPRGQYAEVLVDDLDRLRDHSPWAGLPEATVRGIRVHATPRLGEHHDALVQADVIHIMAPLDGWVREDIHLKDVVWDLHEALVEAGTRNRVTILASGGVLGADHLPKTLICGADAVVLDLAIVAALGCRVCAACTRGEGTCPDGLATLEAGWAVQRLVNMTVAWRDQLLEIMGAMGMRDVRRLRGEAGRAMRADDMVGLAFAGIEGAPPAPAGGGHH